jgi:LEA14-like dessication related protein
MMKHRIGARAIALAALTFGIMALLPSCATRKGEPEALVSPRARIEAQGAVALDQYRTKFPFALELDNPGASALSLESFECALLVDGAEAGRVAAAEPESIGAGDRASFPLELIVDARKLGGAYSSPEGPATAAFRIEARLTLRDAEGRRSAARASAEGSFPIVREPRFEILKLKIERDILVTTNLKLAIEVYNPNAFPLELKSLSYVFDGEGKPWAEGKTDGPFTIGARSSGRIELAFEMNFADRDRALLDLVANLQIVRYRLAGSASVAADVGVPLVFPIEFDEGGSCRVER